jgi:hypothetical protein
MMLRSSNPGRVVNEDERQIVVEVLHEQHLDREAHVTTGHFAGLLIGIRSSLDEESGKIGVEGLSRAPAVGEPRFPATAS